MQPGEWLNSKQGFGILSPAERRSIEEFSLLWSLFEAKALSNHGSAAEIVALVERLAVAGLVDLAELPGALAYWRARYWGSGSWTPHFGDLKFRGNDRRPLVETVMSGASDSDTDVLTALLLIVWRLRNNLFHGHKWAVHFYDQQDNFDWASQVLMAAIDMNQPLE